MKARFQVIGVVLLIILTTLAMAACGKDENKDMGTGEDTGMGKYQTITAEDAKVLIDDNGDAATIVDVRTKEEYDAGHIKGAINIPNEEIKDTKPEQISDINALILIYCRSGNRSAEAAQKLVKMGYNNLYDFGGINDWPYEVVTE